MKTEQPDLEYRPTDTPDSLSVAKLELIARTDSAHLLYFLSEKTLFDAERIRLMLELGAIEARRRAAAAQG